MLGAFWMFPGQGAQVSGIGNKILERYPQVRVWWEHWQKALGEPVFDWVCQMSDRELALTRNTQPHLWVVSVTLGQLLLEQGFPPFGRGRS